MLPVYKIIEHNVHHLTIGTEIIETFIFLFFYCGRHNCRFRRRCSTIKRKGFVNRFQKMIEPDGFHQVVYHIKWLTGFNTMLESGCTYTKRKTQHEVIWSTKYEWARQVNPHAAAELLAGCFNMMLNVQNRITMGLSH